ncbi:Tol-Pal system beta propeller repeat protein TolB [Ectothiorhodospiraceae bacterium WFHF3C12]|nr:Tol-Pal system beta propeller repeat protein TolB [Ectothiorhodospiraceae bacterium WFHF3C12]
MDTTSAGTGVHTRRTRHRRAGGRLIGALLGLSMLLGLTGNIQAQVTIEITGGAEGALPVAIVPFERAEGTPTPPEDVAGIIRNDLFRSGQFKPLPQEDFITTPSTFTNVQFQNWRALGADYLVMGGISAASGGGFEVRFELVDVYGAQRLEGRRFRVQGPGLRNLAHQISDIIYETITGQPGAFNTQIAYVSVSGEGEERQFRLIVAQSDGHNRQTVLTSKQPILSPAWSPDRKNLAYVSFEGRRSEVFVQEVATGKRRKVADFKGINSAPAWSPGGDKLAVTLSKDGNADIYIIDVGSGQTRQITRHWAIDTEPAWSPDGSSLYFTSDRAGRPQIYKLPLGGDSAERVTFEGNYNAAPDISPDGRWLAMVHRGEQGGFRIAVQNLKTGLVRVVTDGPLDESPSFAANGSMLLFAATTDDGRSELATVSVFGRARMALGIFTEDVREPAWSPL